MLLVNVTNRKPVSVFARLVGPRDAL